MNPETGEVIHGTIAEETEVALSSLKLIVEELGAQIDDVVKLRCVPVHHGGV